MALNAMEAEMEKAEEIKELLVDALHKQAEIQNIFITAYLDVLQECKIAGKEIYPYEADVERMQKCSEALFHSAETLEKIAW